MDKYKKELSDIEKKKRKELNEKIQNVLDKHNEEYESLANESDKLYDMEEKLKIKYDELNKKTGLNKFYSKVEGLL